MAFSYVAGLTVLKEVLDRHNTTTASPDLSASMTTRVKTVYMNDPSIFGLRGDIYPAVFVRVNRKREDFGGLGETGPTGVRKQCDVDYDVIGFYRKDGAHGTQAQVLLELERMAANIEGVLQAEMTLSGTALWCQAEETSFYGPFQNDEAWIKAVVVSVKAKYHYR